MRRSLRGLLAALLTLPLAVSVAAGCRRPATPPGAGSDGSAAAPDPAALTPWPASVREVRFVVTPYDDRRVIEESYVPLLRYLGRRIGVPVHVEIAPDYATVVGGLTDGRYDAALGTPLAYVQAKDRDPGIRLLASQVAEGTTSYLGYVYTRAEHEAETLADLAGLSFCYVDPHSVSGYVYPRAMLRQLGHDPDRFFGRTEFGGNHGVCLRRVLQGEVDAAAISSGAVATARREGLPVHQIKVVAKSPRIPYDAWCTSSRLPEAAALRLKEELLALSTRSPDGRSVLQGPIRLNAWIEVDDAHYDSVRAARTLSLPTAAAARLSP